MKRSKWKGPNTNLTFFKRLKDLNDKKTLKEVPRNMSILPKFVNHSFKVHTGNSYSEISVTKEMIGHKFGEFSITRKPFAFKKKKKK